MRLDLAGIGFMVLVGTIIALFFSSSIGKQQNITVSNVTCVTSQIGGSLAGNNSVNCTKSQGLSPLTYLEVLAFIIGLILLILGIILLPPGAKPPPKEERIVERRDTKEHEHGKRSHKDEEHSIRDNRNPDGEQEYSEGPNRKSERYGNDEQQESKRRSEQRSYKEKDYSESGNRNSDREHQYSRSSDKNSERNPNDEQQESKRRSEQRSYKENSYPDGEDGKHASTRKDYRVNKDNSTRNEVYSYSERNVRDASEESSGYIERIGKKSRDESLNNEEMVGGQNEGIDRRDGTQTDSKNSEDSENRRTLATSGIKRNIRKAKDNDFLAIDSTSLVLEEEKGLIFSNSIYCDECGARNHVDSNFCHYCGARLKGPDIATKP